MIDLATLPPEFLHKRRRPVPISALERAAAAARTAIPPTLGALYEGGALSLGGLTLFDDDLLDEYNEEPAPWAAELAASDNPAERLLGDVYGDHRLGDFEGTLFFASDNGGVLAFVDGTNKMGRGLGAVFAISPGAGRPEYARFLAADFDEFVDQALAFFRMTDGEIDLISMAGHIAATGG
jgi:hypothetical protein